MGALSTERNNPEGSFQKCLRPDNELREQLQPETQNYIERDYGASVEVFYICF